MLSQPIYLSALIALILLTTSGCEDSGNKDKKTSAAVARPVTITIVHDNDLKLEQWLFKNTEAFRLSQSGEPLNFKFKATSISSAIDEIADGRLKPDAVVLPHKGFSSLINSKVVNLGTGVKDCQDLISSPYIGLIPSKYTDKVSEIIGRIPESLIEGDNGYKELQVSLAEYNKILLNSRFGFVHPARSTRGSFALLLSIASATPSYFNSVSENRPSWEQALAAASPLKENFEWYAPSDSLILKRLKSQNAGVPSGATIPLGIMSGRQLNPDPEFNHELTVLKITDYMLKEVHSLCLSDADWVTDRKNLLLKDLQKFLASDSALKSAKLSGFLPAAEYQIDMPIGNQKGPTEINIQSPEILLQKSLASFYDKKKAISVAIDTSASMSPRDLDVARNFAFKFLDSDSGDHVDLMTFSSDVTFWNEKSQSKFDVKEKLLKINPSGGSSIYDTLFRQYRGLERFSKTDFAKLIIIITDGGDKNSVRTLQDILNISASSISAGGELKAGFIALHIIAIDNGSGEIKSLQEISETAAGNFYQVSSDSLPALLTELEGLLL